MKLKPGYKQTEIGEISNDWELVSFEQAFKSLRTATYSRDELTQNDEVLYIHYGDIHTKYDNFLDFSKTTLPSISKDKVKNYSFLQEGDLIMVDASEDYTAINKSVEAINIGTRKVISGLHTILLRDVEGFFANGFRGYIIPNCLIKRQLDRLATGMKVYGVSKNNLKKVFIPTPPTKQEQTAIAQALSDTDELISSLDKLVTKKRNIKQGAMQQLLTGKKQLSGHSAKWVIKKMKDFVTQFIVPMRNKPKIFSGEIPWCRIEDFDGKYLFDSKSSQYVSSEIIQQMNLKIYPKGTLLVSCSADLGRCAIVKKELVTNQTFIGLVIDSKKTSNEFMFYYMTFYASILNTLSSGTTISYMSRGQFENFKVTIPSTKEEQTAIAQVLSDMDFEIETLEKKRDKYKAIKQGMMQELLTGRIRLV